MSDKKKDDASASDGKGCESSVQSANAWEKAEFGDNERKQKFLRLMGAAKKEHHGRFVIGDNKADHGRPEDKVNKMNADLEKQYVESIHKKVTTGARKIGLGFSEPEPEPVQPAPTEQGGDHVNIADSQGGANAEQRDRDMQMRGSHHDSSRDDRNRSDRDSQGSYRDRRDHRDEHRQDRQQYKDQRNAYKDHQDNRDRRDNFRDSGSGYQRHSHDRGNRDYGYGERQDSRGYQQHQGGVHQHQGGYDGHRSGFGHNANRGNFTGNQSWSQSSGPMPPAGATVGPNTAFSPVPLPPPPPPPPPPDSQAAPAHGSYTPSLPDKPKAKYQMSFVKSSD